LGVIAFLVQLLLLLLVVVVVVVVVITAPLTTALLLQVMLVAPGFIRSQARDTARVRASSRHNEPCWVWDA
jgi:hypothetical protein